MLTQTQALKLPERVARLDELANNLWWSWHRPARDLFRALDFQLWATSGQNPVKQLRDINPDKLYAAAADPDFLAIYDSVTSAFDEYMTTRDTWFERAHSNLLAGPIAYLSMEFALHHSLPIYAGGLGVLAGDICKEASDLGLPVVGVGFMYPQGYFHQRIGPDGWQEEVYRQLDFSEAPINPVLLPDGSRTIAEVKVDGSTVLIAAWQIRVGRTTIYLLDTNVEGNAPRHRHLSDRLYVADHEVRLQQEIVLGIGGVRVLRALGVEPAIWHMNEGHTAFMTLERIRENVEKGATFAEGLGRVRSTSVFTTHTPVPAGHDVFPIDLIEKCFHSYWQSLQLNREGFLNLGMRHGSSNGGFNMTTLALSTAGQCNAVSQLHGTASRKMWRCLWPNVDEDAVPISQVTNGVHVPTWVSYEMALLYEKHLGTDWVSRQDDPGLWDRVLDIPDGDLWAARQAAKRRLTGAMLGWAQRRWSESQVTPEQVLATGALLHPDVLTIGFVRRFAEYKRPALIFRDIERIKRIVKDRWRPVQIVFAGKSHPADHSSKCILQQVYALATDRDFQGRIAFVEDYDMYSARYLVQGVDAWLNAPRRFNEASGTSGMKASLNGVPHLSVRDGWWDEAYNGVNGWAIGTGPEERAAEEEDRGDAESLYRLLEEELVPLYYERDRSGLPRGWIRVVKEAIRSVAPRFSARRMVKEYADQLYVPAAASCPVPDLIK
jgi:starch phosphorylase